MIPDIKIQTQGDTTIKQMNLAEGATGSQISLDSQTTVENLNLDTKVDIKGAGSIANANVNADNVTFEKAPEKQTVATGVTIKTVVAPPPSASDGYSIIPVTGMTIKSENDQTTIAKDLEELKMSVAIVPENATNQRVVWSVKNGSGTATIASNGALTATGVGKVTVIATNPSSVISAAKEIDVISKERAAAADIGVPGVAGMTVSGVSLITNDGRIGIRNQIPIDESGIITGTAKNQLDAQTVSNGADPAKGYISYTVSAPVKGELTKIVSCTRESGQTVDTEINVPKNLGSADNKGDASFIEAVAEKKGDDWKKVLINTKVDKILWYYADGTILATSWTVSAAVAGTIERDPDLTGGALTTAIDGDTLNFTAGEISWYPENTSLGNEAGNRVGVKITAPAGFDTQASDVFIDNHGYHWADIAGEKNYFYSGNLLGDLDLDSAEGTVEAVNPRDQDAVLAVQTGKSWIIGKKATLTIPDGKALMNSGSITNKGSINGTVTDVGGEAIDDANAVTP